LSAGIALCDRHIVDRHRASDCPRVIVDDRALALTVGDGGAIGGARKIDEERLVWLEYGVAVDDDRNELRVNPGAEGERAASGNIVAARPRGGIRRGGIVGTANAAVPPLRVTVKFMICVPELPSVIVASLIDTEPGLLLPPK